MRITGHDGENKGVTNTPLPAKVSQLLQQLAERPMLIDKITLTQRHILLDILNNNATNARSNETTNLASQINTTLNKTEPQAHKLSQIQLPLSVAGKLADQLVNSGNQAFSVILKQLNKNLALQIIPTSTLNGPQSSAALNQTTNQPTSPLLADLNQLIFQNAQLKSNQLLLSQPTQTANQVKPEHKTSPQADNASLAKKPPVNELQQAISQFLKAKPLEQNNLGAGLTRLLQLESQLAAQLSIAPKGAEQTSQAVKSAITINNSELKQLISLALSLNPKSKSQLSFLQSAERLSSQFNQLKQQLDFSVNNKQLNLEQRIFQSGHFSDAKNLQQNLDNKPSANQATDLNLTTNNQKVDLKLLQQAIKQQIELTLSALNKGQNKVVNSQQLISLIRQDPLVQLLLQVANLTETHLVSTDKTLSSTDSQLLKQAEQLNLSSQQKQLLAKFFGPNVNQQTQLVGKAQANQILNQQQIILRDMLLETNQMISKIETNQLLSLKSDSAMLQQYLLDIPILQHNKVESFELLFQAKDNPQDEKNNKLWTVTVRFDLEPLGPMFARISLKNQRISTHFFADDETTSKLLNENIDHLKNSLFSAGLEVDEITGQQGVVPESLLENNEHSVDLRV